MSLLWQEDLDKTSKLLETWALSFWSILFLLYWLSIFKWTINHSNSALCSITVVVKHPLVQRRRLCLFSSLLQPHPMHLSSLRLANLLPSLHTSNMSPASSIDLDVPTSPVETKSNSSSNSASRSLPPRWPPLLFSHYCSCSYFVPLKFRVLRWHNPCSPEKSSNLSRPGSLVKMLATYQFIVTYTSSSMCLVQAWNTGFFARWILLRLSQ